MSCEVWVEETEEWHLGSIVDASNDSGHIVVHVRDIDSFVGDVMVKDLRKIRPTDEPYENLRETPTSILKNSPRKIV